MPQYKFRVNGATRVGRFLGSRRSPSSTSFATPSPCTAPKFGCGLGQCGACTVPGRRQGRALLRHSGQQAAGRAVTTLEGLGTPEKPIRVQAAFIAEQAAQCGYCTNGMIMAATALLAQTPHPTLDQVKQALAGNLCRCGTHTRILSAVMRVSKA